MNDPSATPAPTRPDHRRTSATGRERVPALDGLRAVGLLLIMGFHFGVHGMSGGFVGVDVFYVLSGYLITGLLLGEWARAARIRLGAFWLRRARRLLPALLVVLVVVTLVVRFSFPAGLYPNLRMADLSALFYFSNWWQIAASGNYFVATGAVSPLTHTWSLAVEEQFYLVWPLVVVAVLHLGRKFDRGIELLLGVSVVGVVASATEMALLYHPRADTTRLYFGTDTHAQSILVGAVLACVLTLVQRRRGAEGMAPTAASTPARVALTVVGLAGFAGTLVLTYTLTGTAAIAYRGGFLLSALSAAAIILGAVCVARGPIARVLSVRPMVWMGTVSYGAYLWHFPVFIELDAGRTGLTGLPLLTLRVAATFVLAGLSYYLVERPVMEGTLWQSLRGAVPSVVAVAATVGVVVVGTAAPISAAAPVRPTRATHPTSTLPPAVHDRLESVGAFSGHPVRFLMIGDSLAITASVGLAAGSVPGYGVQVIDEGVFGCDYDTSPAYDAGTRTIPYNSCLQWRTLYAGDIAANHPDVVGLLTGRWTIADRVVDGTTVHVGDPSFDDHVVTEYRAIVAFLASQGVKVVLFNLPYFDPPQEAADGSVFPEDQPDRVTAFNRDLARVAALERGRVTLVDLNAVLCPHGRFQTVVDGVVARWPDGVHVTPAGGRWLQPHVLPTVALLGVEARAGVTR
jgi:peptidoglycan/LPS O-acetylase OafA/YrhL